MVPTFVQGVGPFTSSSYTTMPKGRLLRPNNWNILQNPKAPTYTNCLDTNATHTNAWEVVHLGVSHAFVAESKMCMEDGGAERETCGAILDYVVAYDPKSCVTTKGLFIPWTMKSSQGPVIGPCDWMLNSSPDHFRLHIGKKC